MAEHKARATVFLASQVAGVSDFVSSSGETLNSTPLDTQTEANSDAQCDDCMKRVAVWYCERCKAICQDCWDERRPHRRNDPAHARTSYEEYVFFGNVLGDKLSEDDRRKLHERDHATLWFAVNGPSGGPLSLEELPRFSQAIGEHRHQYPTMAVYYPRIVSFVGNTGAGKSSIVRLLIEHAWDAKARHHVRESGARFTVPVVGRPQVTIPTSGDVHLYRDPILEPSEVSSPIFYADCEGIGGGQQEPQAHRHQNTALAAVHSLILELNEIRRWATVPFGYLRRGFRRDISATNEREEAVKEMFPRLLYNFSDVVVHVMLSTDARQMENHIAKLLEWANASHSAAINRLLLPHLIVVLNRSDDDSEWDPVKTKRQVLAEQAEILEKNRAVAELREKLQKSGAQIDCLEDLLKESYSSVHFIRLPQVTACVRLSEQLRLLHAMIRGCSQEVQEQKMEAKMLLSSKTLDQFFQLAFDHYAKKLNEPFDFLRALFTVQPVPNILSENLAWMLRQTYKAVTKDIDAENRASTFAQALAPVVCSAIALDAVRSFEHLPGCLVDVFKGDASRRNQNAWKLSSFSYEKQVSVAFTEFVESSVQCQFTKGNAQCVNSYRAHMSLDRHQGFNGDTIGYGSFECELLDEIMKHWETEISAALDALTQLLEHDSGSVVGTSPAQESERRPAPNEAVIWAIHQSHLDRLYEALPSLVIGGAITCFWCMRNKASEILPCFHAVCEACLTAMGNINDRVDSRVVHIDACNLHNPPKKFAEPAEVLLLPRAIGRRVLSIDGGGIRGIISLNILAAIEQKMGGEIPISEFFDLIGGTSVGGLAALGLVLKNWKAKHAVEILTTLSSEAFKPQSEWTLIQMFKRVTQGTEYQTEALENAIRTALGELSALRLFGLAGEKSHGQRTKVFVTATAEDGERGAIFANYTRTFEEPESGAPEKDRCGYLYDFEPAYSGGQGCKVWQAARATSATPLSFDPMRIGGSEFWDGGLFFNNPARVAMCEAERIWPAAKGKAPDILLSVGNGTEIRQEFKPSTTSSPFIRFGSRVMRVCRAHGIFGHLIMLKNRLMKNMDSEAMWDDNFASLARTQPAKYVRLNPSVAGKLPQWDDVQALQSGQLNQIISTYLQSEGTRKKIDSVFFTLVSTSFYFRPTHRSYEADSTCFVIEGRIMCRFANYSSTIRRFRRVIKRLTRPKFLLAGSKTWWDLCWALPESVAGVADPGVFGMSIVVRTRNCDSEVDIRFVADGFEEQSISSFPAVFEESI